MNILVGRRLGMLKPSTVAAVGLTLMTLLVACGGGPGSVNNSSRINAITPPKLTDISPASGPTTGGTTVAITGTDIQKEATVLFGNVPAAKINSVTSTSIEAVTPVHNPGKVDVKITNPDTRSDTLLEAFTFEGGAPAVGGPAPTVSSALPNSGPVVGGTILTITGTDFQSGATVIFGQTPATAVVFSSATQLLATTPTHAEGSVDVIVIDPDGQSATAPSGFTYQPVPAPTISGISPSLGTTAGGTLVTITGTGFQPGVLGTTVTFGGVAATGVTVASSTQMNAIAPAHAEGIVDVIVRNPDGQSATVPSGFTFGTVAIGCGTGTDNSECGNVGDPYEGQGPPSNQVPISACGMTISASGNYKVTQDIGSNASATCISITYNTFNVNLDLGGHTVTGTIFAVSGNGNTIYNGTVTCNKDTSTYPQACVQVYAQITTAQARIHHLTVTNQQELGGIWNVMIEQDNPASYSGGGSGLGKPCRVDHVSITSITGTGAGNRYGGIASQGKCNTELDHNFVHCTGGLLNACQGMGAGEVGFAYIHDNEVQMDPVSGPTQDGRGIICDLGAGVEGTCDIYNNIIVPTNNRAIRYREFPPGCPGGGGPWGIQVGNVYNNIISNIQKGGRLAAIHIGEDDCNLMTTAINIYNNSLELNNGNGIVVVSANGVTAFNNAFTCYGGNCNSAGWPLFTDALGFSNGQTNAYFKNNAIPAGITNSVRVCGPPGNPSHSCSAPDETTSATVCNTGAAVGNGTLTTLTPPCP